MFLAPLYTIKQALRRRYLSRFRWVGYKVSVVVPAWNEEVGIIKTIESVIANQYPNTEIIVINDGSNDNTEKRVKEYIEKNKANFLPGQKIKYYYQENAGKGHALNNGISHASGDIILTIDADSAVSENALQNLVKHFQDPKIHCVVGNVVVANNDSVLGFVQHLEYKFGFYFKRAHSVLGAEYIYGGACAAFRSRVFEEIGLFDTSNKTEDIEMSMRTRLYGFNCEYAEEVICYTEGASSLKGLINQRLRWKKGRFDTFLKYRNLFFSMDKKVNKGLTFFVLPYALLAELQLLFEPIGIALVGVYSIVSGDYVSLALGLFSIFIIYFINAIFNPQPGNWKLLIYYWFSWPVFYLLVWVEFLSLLHGVSMVFKGNNVEWQKWDRKGI